MVFAMNDIKHTPGPWRIGSPGPNGCYTVGTERGLMTAMVAHSINEPDQAEQAEADAKLIASAPELLRCLDQYVKACELQGIKLGSITGDALEAIRAATA